MIEAAIHEDYKAEPRYDYVRLPWQRTHVLVDPPAVARTLNCSQAAISNCRERRPCPRKLTTLVRKFTNALSMTSNLRVTRLNVNGSRLP
jgi:hypothetical protein